MPDSGIKTTLVFDPDISGHHLEYLNYLYCGAGHKHDQRFIFVVNILLKEYKEFMEWPVFKNVELLLIECRQDKLESANIFISSFYRSLLLRRYVLKYKPSKVFLVSLMQMLPFLHLLLPRKVKVNGIIFNIFIRVPIKNLIGKFSVYIKCALLTNKIFEKIFMVNDPVSARFMNSKFNTGIFHFLPDPVIQEFEEQSDIVSTIRKIKDNKIIFLHFGSLSERKGTIELLRAIDLLDIADYSKAFFVFAGNVEESIKNEFKQLTEKISTRPNILVVEGFCSYGVLTGLVRESHYLLIPYKSNFNSSGMLGYSARYGIPLIAKSDGLIGFLVRSNNLGYTYKIENFRALAEIIKKHIEMDYKKVDGSLYMKSNSILSFQNIALG